MCLMTLLQVAAIHLVLSALLMTLLWGVQYFRRNAGIVDAGWSLAMLVGAGLYILFLKGDPARRALVAAVALPWSARLFWHILTDRVIGKPEDGRYRKMRDASGRWVQPVFLAFFLAQALLAAVFCLPIGMAASIPHPPDGWTLLGAGLGILAITMEGVADHQLQRWRSNPENWGKTCRVGLWRYSRHPNYFFEWLHWWSYPCYCAGSVFFLPSLLFPVLMFLFLWYVTGIPYTEAQALRSRGEDYRQYQRETSIFFPWFPRLNARSTGEVAARRAGPT